MSVLLKRLGSAFLLKLSMCSLLLKICVRKHRFEYEFIALLASLCLTDIVRRRTPFTVICRVEVRWTKCFALWKYRCRTGTWHTPFPFHAPLNYTLWRNFQSIVEIYSTLFGSSRKLVPFSQPITSQPSTDRPCFPALVVAHVYLPWVPIGSMWG